jgi:hypothetical protein
MSENHPLPKHIVRIKKLKSLLAIVENSVKGGDNYLFRNLYADGDGKEIDILENGSNSCAAFVSWILLALELIEKPHATVTSAEKDLLNSGWKEISELKKGAILVWEQQNGHRHIGFYVGDNKAISNDSQGSGFPWLHDVTYNSSRKIEKILWHSDLDNG